MEERCCRSRWTVFLLLNPLHEETLCFSPTLLSRLSFCLPRSPAREGLFVTRGNQRAIILLCTRSPQRRRERIRRRVWFARWHSAGALLFVSEGERKSRWKRRRSTRVSVICYKHLSKR